MTTTVSTIAKITAASSWSGFRGKTETCSFLGDALPRVDHHHPAPTATTASTANGRATAPASERLKNASRIRMRAYMTPDAARMLPAYSSGLLSSRQRLESTIVVTVDEYAPPRRADRKI